MASGCVGLCMWGSPFFALRHESSRSRRRQATDVTSQQRPCGATRAALPHLGVHLLLRVCHGWAVKCACVALVSRLQVNLPSPFHCELGSIRRNSVCVGVPDGVVCVCLLATHATSDGGAAGANQRVEHLNAYFSCERDGQHTHHTRGG